MYFYLLTVPPSSVKIYQGLEASTRVSSTVGPFLEGENLTLTCVAHGGK